MVIDARRLELQELFKRLKEIFASGCGADVFIEVLVDTSANIKQIKAFISMTGCRTAIEERDGNYIVRITGTPCCV